MTPWGVILVTVLTNFCSSELISQSAVEFNPFHSALISSSQYATFNSHKNISFSSKSIKQQKDIKSSRWKRAFTDEGFDEYLRQRITGNQVPQVIKL